MYRLLAAMCHSFSYKISIISTVRMQSDWTRRREFDGAKNDALTIEHM